jgi:lysophospholipase L1-like esterase
MRRRVFLFGCVVSLVTFLVMFLLMEIFGVLHYFYKNCDQPSGCIYVIKKLREKTLWEIEKRQRVRMSAETDINKLYGIYLNRRAWQSSFSERGLVPPEYGPRDAYWGGRLLPQNKTVYPAHMEAELNVPGYIQVDKKGFQHVFTTNPPPAHRLLVLGASVAYGAYASTYSNTYFSILARRLDKMGHRIDVSVLASGGWLSWDEVVAFVVKAVDRNDDILIVLNGLNDIVKDPNNEKVAQYLQNMRVIKFLARARGSTLVFALQPFLPQKPVKSPLEQRVMACSEGCDSLEPYYEQMKKGLAALKNDQDVFFLDCSGAFDSEKYTIFADVFHFSDYGHELLGKMLADEVDTILRRKKAGATVITP